MEMQSKTLKQQQRKFIWIFLSPGLLTILVFTTIPAISTLSYSFFEWEGFVRGSFAGFENFQNLFKFPWRDQFFAALAHNTIVFIAIMILQTSLGMLIAYALFRLKRGQRFFRTVTFLPVIFSMPNKEASDALDKLSIEITLNPFSSKSTIVCAPINPHPPVTRIVCIKNF